MTKASNVSLTLPVSSVENNRFIVTYENKAYNIRQHPSQKDILKISELPCIVSTDEHGNVTIKQNFKSKLSEIYKKDAIRDFIVKRDYRSNGSNYVEIIDKYGFTTYLQNLSFTKPFISGQKIQCRVVGITTSRPIVKFFSEGSHSDTKIDADYIERLIEEQKTDSTLWADAESPDQQPSWDVKTFATMLLSNDSQGSFNAECHQWVLTIAKMSDITPGLLSTIRTQCKNLLERSELLKNCSSDTERDFFQNRISFIVERIGYFIEARNMLKAGEDENKDKASEFVDTIIEKLTCSGFIYHPDKNFSIMTCLFLLYPELMQEKIESIFDLLRNDFYLWLREPFRREFIKQLQFFISMTIPKISPADNDNENVENAVSALALQLLLAKDDSDDELFDIDINRAAFLRLCSHLVPKDADIKALLTGAFMSLIGVRTIGKFYNERQTDNPVSLAIVTANNKGLRNHNETPPNVEFTGSGVVMTYNKEGFRFFPADAADRSENVLPDGLLDWNTFRICIPFTKGTSKAAKNTKDIYHYHKLWNDIELGLFSPHESVAKSENAKQLAFPGVEVKIRMTHQDTKDRNLFYCRIEDEKYEGEGFINVQFSKNKHKYGIVGYDPNPDIQCFINNNGHPLLFDAEVVEKYDNGTFEFSIRQKLNEVLRDVEYNEPIQCSIGRKAPNVRTYPAVSFEGESVSIDGIPKDVQLHQGDIVEVRPKNFDGGYVQSEFIKKLEGENFNITDAFRDLMIFYSNDEEYIDDPLSGEDDNNSLDRMIPPRHIAELIAIIDRLSVLDNDYVKAYNYLGIAVILARMMSNDQQVGYFKKRMEMILLLHDFAMNDSIDEQRLNNIKDIDSNLFENFSFLRTRLMQLQIVSCNGSSSDNPSLWHIINSNEYRDLHKLASCVLAYNLTYRNLPEIAENIHTEMKRLLNLRGEQSEKKFYGKEDLYTEFKLSLVIPENSTKYDAKAQTHKILEEICAMLNAKGGHLYLGVNDMGIGSGISADLAYDAFKGSTDKYMVYLNNSISNNLGERADRYCNVTEDTYNDFTVIDIAIRPAKEPVSLDGEYYERRNTSSRKVKDVEKFKADFKEDRAIMAQSIVNEVYEEEEAPVEEVSKTDTPPIDDYRPAAPKPVFDEKISTSIWRNNALHDYDENYRNDVVAYIYFVDHDNFKVVKDDIWEEESSRLTLAIHEEEQSEYLLMVYDDGTVNKVDMEELLERHKGKLYKYDNGKELVFVSPAKNEDALLIENKAKNGTTYLRVDDIAPLDVSNMNSPGMMTTEIELGKVIRCEIIPESMKHDINLNFSKKAYGFFENTEDGKAVLQTLERLYNGQKEM